MASISCVKSKLATESRDDRLDREVEKNGDNLKTKREELWSDANISAQFNHHEFVLIIDIKVVCFFPKFSYHLRREKVDRLDPVQTGREWPNSKRRKSNVSIKSSPRSMSIVQIDLGKSWGQSFFEVELSRKWERTEMDLVCGEKQSKNSNPGPTGSLVHVLSVVQVPAFWTFLIQQVRPRLGVWAKSVPAPVWSYKLGVLVSVPEWELRV